MSKVKVESPSAEFDGDEMAPISWPLIKVRLILPCLDIDLKNCDLETKAWDDIND